MQFGASPCRGAAQTTFETRILPGETAVRRGTVENRIGTFLTRSASSSVTKTAPAYRYFQRPHLVRILRATQGVKWVKWIKRSFIILMLYGIGIAEGYYLPRYGIEWLLGGIGATAFLAGLWMRTNWKL